MLHINVADFEARIVTFWFSTAFNMWLPLTLLVFAGLVSADYDHGWKVGNEYTYLVRSRTLTSLNKLSNQYSGILQKALLTVQAKDGNTLGAKVWKGQYAKIHKDLPLGWESEISDQALELRDWPLSEKPFEIKIKHGIIRDLIVDKDVSTWEVNILKAIVSQLQVDTQGENAIKSNSMQIPNDEEPFGMFKAMEDSVGGKCEVLYDTTPLPPYMIQMKPELVPLPHLKGDGMHIDIMKTKNFSRCDQRIDYHFGIAGQSNWEPGTNDNGKFLSKSSSSRIVISGNLKRFTIQSSVTTNKMYVSPRFYDNQNGLVASKMNLTLRSMGRTQNTLAAPDNPESTGNLVYMFNNPFSDFEERRLKPNNMDSNQVRTSDSVSSVSSSEEMLKNGQNPGLRGSSSSSASSSSISSSEEHQFWQPKPTLEEAPQNPLLPNFIGYKGKFLGKSGEIDLVKATKELVFQIANELEDPNNIPTHETLDKFTILSSLIRLMSRRQIAEAENNMHISPNELKSNDKSQAVKQNAWAVFRDAVTQAGTGPALLTIKSWIEKKNVEGMEAAEIVSRIPKTARAPTAQYIRACFDLATSPLVMNENLLNSTAILAFAELVRYVQVNSASLHNRYPVHTFGRLVSKHDKAVVEDYIPALARELQNAVKNGNSPRIQTLIMALGSIAHPRILSVFEPYLEGKQPVSVFQRTLMVAAMSKMTNIYPKLARSVLYRIYLNTMEAHEVRCTAVFLLMKTNPPLSMLQRMAEFTNYDTNKHVNSAVKSSIKSLAALTSFAAQELASKARAAQNLLNPSDYSYQFSRGAAFDYESKLQNVLLRTIMNYIGSDDSVIPRSLYLGWFSSYGDFKVPPTELTAMISSIRPLANMLQSWHHKKHSHAGKTMAEQIAEELNIVPEQLAPLEGNLMWNTKFESAFLPFDMDTLNKISSLLTNNMNTKNMRYFNLNKLMSYDVTLSFPTETGLPFICTFRLPILYKLSGLGQMQMNSGISMNIKSDIRAVYSEKIQGRIGFVTPYDHQHYIAGVDANFQVYAPLRLALDVNQAKKNVQLKVLPLKGEQKTRLIHYSVIPYTSTHNILNLRPLLLEKNTHKVLPQEIQSKTESLPAKLAPAFQLNLEAEKTNEEFWKLNKGDILSPWLLENDQYRQADLYCNMQQDSQKPLVLNVAYDSMTAQAGAENSQQWTPTTQAIEPSDKQGNSQERRQQLMKEAMKGIKLAKSYVMDIQVQIPSERPAENTLTVAWSTSNVENKVRTLAHCQINMPEQTLKYEVCAATQASSNVNPLLSYEETIKSKPKVDFDVDVRYGETCSSNQKINVKGQLTQSNQMKDKIKHARLVMACQEEMQQGNKNLQTCQDAANLARTMDEIEVSLDIQSEKLRQQANGAVEFIGNTKYMNTEMDTSKPKNAGKSKIDIKAKLSKDCNKAQVLVHTSAMDLQFKDVPMPDLGIIQQDVWRVNENALLNKIEQSCVLDKTRAQTFDGKTYPLRLGNCWHVVMTTYAKLNPENGDEKLRTPENIRITILSKETENGQKEMKVILGDQEIKLIPTNSQPEAIVNGQNVMITQDSSYQEKQGEKVLFELFRLRDNSIGLASEKYELNLVYDGKRIMIKANQMYRDTLRGLCGNFDGDVTNDFTAPQNCVLRKPEQFIATYALTNQQCEGESAQIVKQISQKDCIRQMSNRPSNVISDVDAGRINLEIQKWGYHQGEKRNNQRSTVHRTQVIEVNDQICFSIRPVVACAPGFVPTEVKNKNCQFHCMDRNQASLNMKKRVEKGANPDLSQKSISMSRPIDVPLACQA